MIRLYDDPAIAHRAMVNRRARETDLARRRAAKQAETEALILSMKRALRLFFEEHPDLAARVSDAQRKALARQFVRLVLRVAGSG